MKLYIKSTSDPYQSPTHFVKYPQNVYGGKMFDKAMDTVKSIANMLGKWLSSSDLWEDDFIEKHVQLEEDLYLVAGKYCNIVPYETRMQVIEEGLLDMQVKIKDGGRVKEKVCRDVSEDKAAVVMADAIYELVSSQTRESIDAYWGNSDSDSDDFE